MMMMMMSENELSEPLQDFNEETLKKDSNGKGFSR